MGGGELEEANWNENQKGIYSELVQAGKRNFTENCSGDPF